MKVLFGDYINGKATNNSLILYSLHLNEIFFYQISILILIVLHILKCKCTILFVFIDVITFIIIQQNFICKLKVDVLLHPLGVICSISACNNLISDTPVKVTPSSNFDVSHVFTPTPRKSQVNVLRKGGATVLILCSTCVLKS